MHSVKLIILFVSTLSLCSAWGAIGHMLVAQIAKNELSDKSMKILNHCNKLIESLNPLSSPSSQDFV
jgi:hypothetical protein